MSGELTLDIRQWLTALSLRCHPRTTENIEVLAADYALNLTDLNREVWCPAARQAASLKFESFPTYRSLRKFLEDWIDRNCTAKTNLLPPVDDPNLSEEDKTHVRSWIRLRGEGNRVTHLSVCRRWPAAFAYIIRTDDDAAAIARQHGWITTAEEPVDVSEGGIARNLVKLEQLAGGGGNGAALASLGLSMLRKAVERQAPGRLALLPDRMQAQRAESARSVGEQLGELRTSPEAAAEEVRKAYAAHEAKGGVSAEALTQLRAAAGMKTYPVIDGVAEPPEEPPPEPPPSRVDPVPADAEAPWEPWKTYKRAS